MNPREITNPQIPRPLPSPGRTYVPWALMRPAWSAEYPKRKDSWDPVRDAMTWLEMMSIEEAMELYEKWIRGDDRTVNPALWRRLQAWFKRLAYGTCHHGVNTWLKACPTCTSQHHEALQYLTSLKQEVITYYNSQEFWISLDGYSFERHVADLFAQLGCDVQLTPGSGDSGVDLFLRRSGRTTVVQCKAHRQPIGPSVVRDLYGSMQHFNADDAILINIGGFTSGVREFAKGKPITLMDLHGILHLQHRQP